MLFEIADKENLSSKKVFYDALKRLNPSLSIKAPLTKKTIRKKSSNQKKKTAIMTVPYIKLLNESHPKFSSSPIKIYEVSF